jgi:hypothetical protein
VLRLQAPRRAVAGLAPVAMALLARFGRQREVLVAQGERLRLASPLSDGHGVVRLQLVIVVPAI